MPWTRRTTLTRLRNRAADYYDAYQQQKRATRRAVDNTTRLAADLDASERRREQQAAVINDLRHLLDGQPHTSATAMRLERALRACVGYRRELASQARLIRDQQRQLDQLLGMDNPKVLAGAAWQQRRPDKRKEYSA